MVKTNTTELKKMLEGLEKRYCEFCSQGLKLDMSRGKPCPEQLDLSAGLMDCITKDDYLASDGTDCRNYGGIEGIPEARRLFAELLQAAPDEVIMGGHSSLSFMYDAIARAWTHGVYGSDIPWGRLPKVKFLCPSPGFDRHFSICEHFGIEMITIDMKEDGPVMVFIFGSTSKITLPGAGVSMMAASENNIKMIINQMKYRTINPDKMNQLRHVRFLKDMRHIEEHMKRHAEILRPKFSIVLDTLDSALEGLGIAWWTRPKGGYFISLNTLDGCAGHVVSMAAKAGVALTQAGATYPYGKDPRDRNIRIAPSYPQTSELKKAVEILCLCIKIVSIRKLLGISMYNEKGVG